MSASLISHTWETHFAGSRVPSLPRPGRRAARIRKPGHRVKPVRSAPDRSIRFCLGSPAREYDRPDRRSDPWFVQYRRGPPRRERLGQAGGEHRRPARSDRLEGGEETKVLDRVNPVSKWAMRKEGIYFVTQSVPQRTDICFYHFATRDTTKVLTLKVR